MDKKFVDLHTEQIAVRNELKAEIAAIHEQTQSIMAVLDQIQTHLQTHPL